MSENNNYCFLTPLGNANLVYTIIRKRHVFHALANLPSDVQGISKCLNSRKISVTGNHTVNRIQNPKTPSPTTELKSLNNDAPSPPMAITTTTITTTTTTTTPTKPYSGTDEEDVSSLENKSDVEESMEGSRPAQPAEPGTLKVSLLDTPAIATMTERESAHPLTAPLCDFSPMNEHLVGTNVNEVEHVELSKLSFDESKETETETEIETLAPLKRTVTQVVCLYDRTLFEKNLDCIYIHL